VSGAIRDADAAINRRNGRGTNAAAGMSIGVQI
jgi:hypothetical protein